SKPSRRILSPEQVQQILSALGLREQLLVRLALFSGMRPGEILALQWKHVHDDHVQVVHRLYRGIIDRPKSERSNRTVALSSTTRQAIAEWRQQQNFPGPDAWVFPSATLKALAEEAAENYQKHDAALLAWHRAESPAYQKLIKAVDAEEVRDAAYSGPSQTMIPIESIH